MSNVEETPKKTDLFEGLKRNKKTTETNFLSSNFKNNDKPKMVLLTTGSFNPVHFMHINMFGIAKNEMEKIGFNIIGGYISPSQELYVKRKLGEEETIKIEHRVDLLKAAIDDFGFKEWLKVDLAESQHQNGFIDHHKVLISLKKYLNTIFPEENIRVAYLCGYDMYLRVKGNIPLQKKDFGVVVIKRAQTAQTRYYYYQDLDKQLEKELETRKKEGKELHIWFLENPNSKNLDLSSSSIRKFILQKQIDQIPKEFLPSKTFNHLKSIKDDLFIQKIAPKEAPKIKLKQKNKNKSSRFYKCSIS